MAVAPIITIRDLSVRYGRHEALHDVSFTVESGETVAIIGPNGSGKTTLVRALLGLAASSGTIEILGTTPKHLDRVAARIGYVPQRLELDRSAPLSVAELLGLFLRVSPPRPAIEKALRDVDALPFPARRLAELSGGEFQRVLLALALENNPELLILDEPLAGLDVEGESIFYEALEGIRRTRALTTLIVSHDLSAVYRHATKVICINHRMLCSGVPSEVLTKEMLGRVYGSSAFYAHER